MVRIKRSTRHAEKTPWFRYRSNHPYKDQLILQQQSRDPQYANGNGYDHQEEVEMECSNSVDLELVDPSISEKQVSNEFEEKGGDQETGADGDDEKEEGFGDLKAPEYQDPPSLYHNSLENYDNGYDNSSDDCDRNKRCRTQPRTSPECSESETEMVMMKIENDHDTGLDRLKMWMDGMGLGQYKPLFKIHKVDDEVLQLLTVKDLKDMGVPLVGLRWKIYMYIKNFCI